MNATEVLLDSLEADAPVRQVLVGAFWTAVVLSTDPPRCGLALTLRPATPLDCRRYYTPAGYWSASGGNWPNSIAPTAL